MIDFQSIPFFLFPPLLCIFSYALFARTEVRKPNTPYPPGPEPKPLIGNALDIPFQGRPWLKYLQWSKDFCSDIVHVSAMNTHFVVLHKLEDAIELFEKKSAAFSDRPAIPITEMIGADVFTFFLPYGDRWRKHRRIFQAGLRKEQISSYHDIQRKKVHQFLGKLLRDTTNIQEHCKWLSASLNLAMTYAYDVGPEQKDNFMQAGQFASSTAAELFVPGRTLINVLPFLKYIPSWIPGAHTQRLAARLKQIVLWHKSELFEYVKENMAANRSEDCFLVRLLQRGAKHESTIFKEETLKDVMASIWFAGVDTLQSSQMTCIFSIVLHHESQRKAQAEIDRVVGTDRLPTFEDRPSLPYVEALYREIQRWRPVVPLGFVHAARKDGLYKGYYIPKGTYLMPNVWFVVAPYHLAAEIITYNPRAMTRDETRYHDPERFLPDRFFNADGTLNDDTVSYGFGFGRRVCPGRYFADSVLWLMLASMLSTFNFAKAKDSHGNEIDIDTDAFVDSLITHPLTFKCAITPRSQEAKILIQTSESGGDEAIN